MLDRPRTPRSSIRRTSPDRGGIRNRPLPNRWENHGATSVALRTGDHRATQGDDHRLGGATLRDSCLPLPARVIENVVANSRLVHRRSEIYVGIFVRAIVVSSYMAV